MNLKNRMMDFRKTTNHPYLTKYPLTDDGVFYRSDMIDCCGKLKVINNSNLFDAQYKRYIFEEFIQLFSLHRFWTRCCRS